jgi:hypothetical protein
MSYRVYSIGDLEFYALPLIEAIPQLLIGLAIGALLGLLLKAKSPLLWAMWLGIAVVCTCLALQFILAYLLKLSYPKANTSIAYYASIVPGPAIIISCWLAQRTRKRFCKAT